MSHIRSDQPSRISIETGTHDQFAADLLVCRYSGNVFRSLEPSLEFKEFVSSFWAASLGGHERKLALYRSQDPNCRQVLAVAYRPNSDRPEAFASNRPPHGCNITMILLHGLWRLMQQGRTGTIVITSLSWRNPTMMDHVLASVLVECKQTPWMQRPSITLVLPSPRPELVRLFEGGYSIWRRYLLELEAFYSG